MIGFKRIFFPKKRVRRIYPHKKIAHPSSVTKVGGAIIDDNHTRSKFANGILQLYREGRAIIIVFGAGKQIDYFSELLGITPKKVGGRRITGKQDLYAASLGMDLAGMMLDDELSELGVPSVRIPGENVIEGEKRPPVEITDEATGKKVLVDFGYVADIRVVDKKMIDWYIHNGYVPLISSMTRTENGQRLNCNADTVAYSIATAGYDTFVIVTDAPGVWDSKKKVISYMTVKRAREMMERGDIEGGMRPKVNACLNALNSAYEKNRIKRTHITDVHGLVPELDDLLGYGTMIMTEDELPRYLEEIEYFRRGDYKRPEKNGEDRHRVLPTDDMF